ncbi:MAG TPA: isoprenylcysteine carboxylmethyltransferase family protein [Vicinamibacterales bacterium]|nr:isoprenylcysteine carboxylmethyltransferase family protein [Vicinamibacterales bacterium]
MTLPAMRARLLGRGGIDIADAAVPSRRQEQVAPAPARRRGDRLADFAGRAVIVALFTLFLTAIIGDFSRTGRVTGLLLVASEGLVVVLTLFRRSASWLDRSWRARILTGLSLLGPPLVRPAASASIVPDGVTVALSAVGLTIVVAGKISLGRSFGLMPANRGIVCGGVYRFLRHPIYAGYLVTHVAFLAAHLTPLNVALLLVADIALLARAVLEERTLALDPLYLSYQQRVRWRVVPGVF